MNYDRQSTIPGTELSFATVRYGSRSVPRWSIGAAKADPVACCRRLRVLRSIAGLLCTAIPLELRRLRILGDRMLPNLRDHIALHIVFRQFR